MSCPPSSPLRDKDQSTHTLKRKSKWDEPPALKRKSKWDEPPAIKCKSKWDEPPPLRRSSRCDFLPDVPLNLPTKWYQPLPFTCPSKLYEPTPSVLPSKRYEPHPYMRLSKRYESRHLQFPRKRYEPSPLMPQSKWDVPPPVQRLSTPPSRPPSPSALWSNMSVDEILQEISDPCHSDGSETFFRWSPLSPTAPPPSSRSPTPDSGSSRSEEEATDTRSTIRSRSPDTEERYCETCAGDYVDTDYEPSERDSFDGGDYFCSQLNEPHKPHDAWVDPDYRNDPTLKAHTWDRGGRPWRTSKGDAHQRRRGDSEPEQYNRSWPSRFPTYKGQRGEAALRLKLRDEIQQLRRLREISEEREKLLVELEDMEQCLRAKAQKAERLRRECERLEAALEQRL